MSERPYIVYPRKTAPLVAGQPVPANVFVNEPGKVSCGVLDFVPGLVRATHHHDVWELIIIDSSSPGPGYVFFDEHWWRTNPGAAVFIPAGYAHAWSAGNNWGFKMLWIYGGTRDEAGRHYHVEPDSYQAITAEEEKGTAVWEAD